MTLEEEYKALLSDKDGETEYLCSLQDRSYDSFEVSETSTKPSPFFFILTRKRDKVTKLVREVQVLG